MAGTIKTTAMPNAGVLDGTERLALVVGSTSKQSTTRQIADLAGSSIGGGAAQSVAALRLLTPPTVNGVTVQTLGYYVANDGGGVFYQWSSSSTADDNGNTVIRPSTSIGDGRWLMVYAETLSVVQFGAKGDGVTNDLPAFTAALAVGNPVLVPPLTFALSGGITLRTGSRLYGLGRPTLTAIGASRFFTFFNISDAVVEGFNCVSSASTSSSNMAFFGAAPDCVLRDCYFPSPRSALIVSTTSRRVVLDQLIINNCNGTAIELNGLACQNNTVMNCQFTDNQGFCIRLNNGANRNLIQGNQTLSNTIELVGVNPDCHYNRIVANHAEGCGDNGISISGNYNVCVGNTCRDNQNAGIFVFGRNNLVTGNTCTNNGYDYLSDSIEWPGIGVQGRFGGTGQNNTIVGNVCDDDQASPTQYVPIKIGGLYYDAWTASTAYTAGDIIRHDMNIYTAAVSGSSGTTAPTHTSGTASDGGITWTWVDAFQYFVAESAGNVVWGNVFGRSVSGSEVQDNTINQVNVVQRTKSIEQYGAGGTNVVTGGQQIRATVWTNAAAVTYGMERYTVNARVYRCANIGGTCSVQPTHTSGTFTGADGIAWRYIRSDSQRRTLFSVGDTSLTISGSLLLENVQEPGEFGYMFRGTGSPEGVVTAPVGSTFSRKDGGAGSSFYVKESGSGSTGWVGK